MHSSKGLEFDIVFIIDANEGVCPHKKAILDEDIEEERRMFYVAMTRAKSRNEGARPIAKLIDKNVRNMISDGIISGEFSTGDGIYADIADDDSYSVRKIKSCTCYR